MKRMKENEVGNSKVYPCNSPLVMGLYLNHPDRALQKNKSKKNLQKYKDALKMTRNKLLIL